MRKSTVVPLTILASLALFPGCRNRYEGRNCVDETGRITPDRNCEASSPGGTPYHYVYGGASGGRIGDRVIGGHATPSEAGVTRGGFGRGGSEGGLE
jgi:hypothetical protein